MPEALLLDLEVVLADTGALRRASLADALAAEGYGQLAAGLDPTLDARDARSAAQFALAGTGIQPDETTLDLIVARADRAFAARFGAGVTLRPDALSFVERAMSITRLALLTRLRRADAERALSLAGLEHAFEAIVAAEDPFVPRPHADVYTNALQRLSRKREVRASRCIAIEDSLAGIGAARRAGLRVVATGPVTAPRALEAGADGYVASLEGLTVDSLAVLAGWTTRNGEPCP